MIGLLVPRVDGVVEIPLLGGYVTVVDASDYPRVSEFNWYIRRAGKWLYAQRGGDREGMHRLIMGCSPGDGLKVGHRNGDGLDNRRGNLVYSTIAQQQAGQRPQANRSSLFKGVSWHRLSGKWMVNIGVKGRRVYLGTFSNEEVAARAYDAAALRVFGEYARLNFPLDTVKVGE
jgi:hypothetical protein